jgi:hypothetical protein
MTKANVAALRVAARFQRKALEGDGKFVGNDARLTWTRHEWHLEELPQKGKKKLKSATLRNPSGYGWRGTDAFLAGNILRDAKLSQSDGYGRIKEKMLSAYEEAVKSMEEGRPEEKEMLAKQTWIREVQWYENDVFYLNVVPEGTDPFTVDGKDFTMKVEWTKFSAYSPDSDMQQADPYYSKIEQSSPTGARKLYLILKANPDALKSVGWMVLGDWLTKQKIPYETNHSVWH